MRLYIFRRDAARHIESFGSQGASLARLLTGNRPVQVVFLRLEPEGVLGRHPAATEQLLLVVEGSGWVSGANGHTTGVAAGALVYWEAGESHETRAGGDGLTGLLIEGEDLTPDGALQALTLKGL